MNEPLYEITFLTGTKVFKPVEYNIVERVTGPWWWRRTRYWIECEFSRLGPFDTKDEAYRSLLIARSVG